MGKATGFLEYQRDETPERSPLERILSLIHISNYGDLLFGVR